MANRSAVNSDSEVIIFSLAAGGVFTCVCGDTDFRVIAGSAPAHYVSITCGRIYTVDDIPPLA